MVIRKVCPQCTSSRYKKNGHIHNDKQNHHCHDGGRQFVPHCEQYLISEEKRGLIERLLPAAQYKALSKFARKTNHIKRINNTLRQRVSQRVRDALSFSKKLANHSDAMKRFICHYNLTRVAAESEHYMDITTIN